MLLFEEVTKSFKDGNRIIEAVKPTSLTFNRGDIVAIVGPSGSGKSTLLTMAGALQTPTSGTITIDDQSITTMNQKALAQVRMDKIGFILQASNLVPFLTVQQQFELLAKHKQDVLSRDELVELLCQLGIDQVIHQLPSDISGGQRQRVAIAKALYTNPSIILADEPTASLDTENALEVMQILKEQSKQRDKLCFIVTHDDRLTDFCDSVFYMEDGQLNKQTLDKS